MDYFFFCFLPLFKHVETVQSFPFLIFILHIGLPFSSSFRTFVRSAVVHKLWFCILVINTPFSWLYNNTVILFITAIFNIRAKSSHFKSRSNYHFFPQSLEELEEKLTTSKLVWKSYECSSSITWFDSTPGCPSNISTLSPLRLYIV